MVQSRILLVSIVTLLTALSVAHAQDMPDDEMRQDGFGKEADLYRSMSPEQREAVIEQALKKQQDLKKMSSEQVEKLRAQLHAVDSTLYVEKVDPDKLDADKSKSTADTLKDLDTYQQKYSQGKINNAVVRPLGENP